MVYTAYLQDRTDKSYKHRLRGIVEWWDEHGSYILRVISTSEIRLSDGGMIHNDGLNALHELLKNQDFWHFTQGHYANWVLDALFDPPAGNHSIIWGVVIPSILGGQYQIGTKNAAKWAWLTCCVGHWRDINPGIGILNCYPLGKICNGVLSGTLWGPYEIIKKLINL